MEVLMLYQEAQCTIGTHGGDSRKLIPEYLFPKNFVPQSIFIIEWAILINTQRI